MPGHELTWRLTRRMALAGLAMLPVAARSAAPFRSRRIAVRAVGTGRDVLLIPGLGTGPDVWTPLIRALPGWRWHLIHVRGFAGLPPEANRVGPLLAPIADEIARYMREGGLSAPAIIGHSMGGTLAMLTALAAARSGPLMVVDMLPDAAALLGGTSQGMGFLANQMRGYFTGTLAGRRAFARLLRDAAPGAKDSDPDVVATALSELAGLDLSPRLPRLAAPLTVVPAVPVDTDARAMILATYRRAYRPAAKAQIQPIGPSGHMIMFDQPDAFARAVKAMLGAK